MQAVRLVSNGDYDTGEGFALGFRMSVPAVAADEVAWNSVAAFARTTGGVDLLPTESPKVGITATEDPSPAPGGPAALGATGAVVPPWVLPGAVVAIGGGVVAVALARRRWAD